MVFEIKKFEFASPTWEEIKLAKRIAEIDPEELDDRDLWILQELGEGDFE